MSYDQSSPNSEEIREHKWAEYNPHSEEWIIKGIRLESLYNPVSLQAKIEVDEFLNPDKKLGE